MTDQQQPPYPDALRPGVRNMRGQNTVRCQACGLLWNSNTGTRLYDQTLRLPARRVPSPRPPTPQLPPGPDIDLVRGGTIPDCPYCRGEEYTIA